MSDRPGVGGTIRPRRPALRFPVLHRLLVGRGPSLWRAPAADQQLQEPVLRVVGVLVLVDEHVPEVSDE